jgi:hypothetical protein
MKVYSGTRVFDREGMTYGKASVVVQNVVSDGPVGPGLTSESKEEAKRADVDTAD